VSRPRRPITLVIACLGLAVAIPAGALGSLSDRKDQVDAQIAALQAQISGAKEKEGVLSSEIETASSEIGSLEGKIGSLSELVAELEADLAEHRSRLARLQAKYEEQTRRLEFLVAQHELAQKRLEERLVELYQTGETTELEILLQVASLNDLIEQIDYFRQIGNEDRRIVAEIKGVRDAVRVARRETAATKKEVEQVTAVLAEKTAEQRAARDQLVAQQSALVAARDERQSLLASVRDERHEHEEDLDAMQAASASLADQIRASQASSSESSGSSGSSGSGVSSSGLIWPVSGPVVSGFGPRWGSMHEGIDIAVPNGTAVHAAAGGTIIYAGGMGGYGNIVVIDHGNGLATAYAHLSAIWVGGGSVAQGQAIAASGCTGHCLGPHLHFEVRVNGSPVDPLGYL
jgi:murein DD-endopeptidase MepM/ murein hydrolase activator NlpD